MSVSKSVQKILFLAIIGISAVILCFVGVWASNAALNLKFTAQVSPDILCRIEAESAGQQGRITIFDNSGTGTAEDFLDQENNLKNFQTSLSGTVATQIVFTLTNFTPNKNIRLSISSITANGNALENSPVSASFDNANADMGNGTSSSALTLNLTSSAQTTQNIVLSLLVEEVYKVSLIGTGLASPNSAHYFSATETPTVTITPAVGYQVPESVVGYKNTTPSITTMVPADITYQTQSNLSATASFPIQNALENNAVVLANCENVFTIHQNSAPSLFKNAQSGFIKTSVENGITTTLVVPDGTEGGVACTYAPVPQTQVLPNNGEYYYTSDNQYVIQKNGYKDYPLYVNMGAYPQTQVKDEDLITRLTSAPAIKNYAQRINNNSSTITWHELDGEFYARTLDYKYATANQGTISWFKVEPVSWIVLGAISQDNKEFSAPLYLQNQMLYTDPLCGKPFTGSLMLMSAYSLDSSRYDTTSSAFATSELSSFMSSQIGQMQLFNKTKTISNAFAQSSASSGASYVSYTALTNHNVPNSSGGFSNNISMYSNMFLLGAFNDQTNKETFWAGDFFANGSPELSSTLTTSTIAVSSPTDYALAHYAQSSKKLTTDDEATAPSIISDRGWTISGTATTNQNVATCAYWTRSSHFHSSPDNFDTDSEQAATINLAGGYQRLDNYSYSTKITDGHIGVRPCMMLNVGFYHTNNFYK